MNAREILTMPSSELRKRAHYLNSTALWGRDGGRQFGSPEDLAISRSERDGFARMAAGMRRFAEALNASLLPMAEATRRLGESLALSPEQIKELAEIAKRHPNVR